MFSHMRNRIAFPLGVVILSAVAARGGEPPPGTKVAVLPVEEAVASRHSNDHGEITLVPVEGDGSDKIRSKRAFRIRTLKPLRSVWEIQLCGENSAAVRRGQPALLRFWARTVEIPDNATAEAQGKIAAYFQRGSEPWDKSFLIKRDVPRKWTLYQYPFRLHETFNEAEAQICIGLGFEPQTIELTGVQVCAYAGDVDLESLPRSPQ